MIRRKVVSWKSMPSRLPINMSVVVWLVLDRLKPPGWVWGACGAVLLIVWVASIISMCREEGTEIWPDK